MKVFQVQTQSNGAMAPSNDTLWVTEALAQRHIEKKAKELAAFLGADLGVETRWRMEPRSRRTSAFVEVKTGSGWVVRMKYFVYEETVFGDAVGALAQVVE